MTNQFKYFLNHDNFGVREVFPLGEGGTSETYQPLGGFVNDFRREISGEFTLAGEDFDWINSIERSNYRCEALIITIQKKCSGVFADWYIGKLKMTEASWNPEQCIVKFKISANDPYTCYEDKKETDIDLFSVVGDRHVLKLLLPDSVLEYTTCSTALIPVPFAYWCAAGRPEDSGWTLWKHEFATGTNTTYYVREKRVIDCALDLSDPWIFISEVCPGAGRTFVRRAVVYGNTESETRDGSGNVTAYTRTRKVFGRPEDGPTEIDNGMKLRDVLIYLADLCDLTLVSNFFQINPTTITAINYVTGQPSKVLSLLVFQKSDVKRPGATENATICTANYEKLFEGICLLFNLEWRINGSTLRLEHCSYFSTPAGLDLTLSKYRKFVRFKHRYSYDTTKLPAKETFKFQEAINGDFPGTPIVYENDCATSGEGSEKEYSTDIITTDLLHVLNNPEPDSETVSDEGIFLAACEEMIDNCYLITEAGILFGTPYPNNSLAWSQLLRDYHRHKRPFSFGKMNLVLTTFDSVIPTLKGEELSIPFCCGDVFNPSDLVKTALGDGYVEGSAFRMKNGVLKLNLLYKVQADLIYNSPPVANADAVNIFKNQTIDIDVLANDSDAQGIGSIDLVQIVTGPVNGTASIVNKKIRYIPTSNFVGADAIYYRIRDNFGEFSNTALVTVGITDPAPIATNKTFTVKKNFLNVIPAPGVMTGDSAGAGTTIIVISNTTPSATQGVAIAVNSDGSFNYNAPNLVGTDTFNYTIQNDQSLTDTGTITLDIITVPASTLHILSKSTFSGPQACTMYAAPPTRQNFYSIAATLIFGSVLYSNELLTIPAGPGYYSNGISIYEITGSGGVIQNISSC